MALFHVRMDVNIPNDLDPEVRADTLAREKAYSQELQRSGTWRALWRIVGRYSNISIFDVESGDELHEILQGLPLFPYMDIEVMALTRHPSRIE
ncbi:muconolactone Delta-isomerase [Dietzia maris]|uniref:muconolactone Delta-isomerase n=1 Tax=Dietzia TaxID=37914 RepID=UPI000BDFAECE|nr:muconolactone Delta-isomerase [Dietzia sp. WMMA184]